MKLVDFNILLRALCKQIFAYQSQTHNIAFNKILTLFKKNKNEEVYGVKNQKYPDDPESDTPLRRIIVIRKLSTKRGLISNSQEIVVAEIVNFYC